MTAPKYKHSSESDMSTDNTQLSEQFIQDSFHSYLKSSLTQAKAERLLDVDLLSSAEGDLMITGISSGWRPKKSLKN